MGKNFNSAGIWVNQDNLPGMVRYFRADSDYDRVKKILAIALMEFLDNN